MVCHGWGPSCDEIRESLCLFQRVAVSSHLQGARDNRQKCRKQSTKVGKTYEGSVMRDKEVSSWRVVFQCSGGFYNTRGKAWSVLVFLNRRQLLVLQTSLCCFGARSRTTPICTMSEKPRQCLNFVSNRETRKTNEKSQNTCFVIPVANAGTTRCLLDRIRIPNEIRNQLQYGKSHGTPTVIWME